MEKNNSYLHIIEQLRNNGWIPIKDTTTNAFYYVIPAPQQDENVSYDPFGYSFHSNTVVSESLLKSFAMDIETRFMNAAKLLAETLMENKEAGNKLEDSSETEHHSGVVQEVVKNDSENNVEDLENQIEELTRNLDEKADSIRYIRKSLIDMYIVLYYNVTKTDDIPSFYRDMKSSFAQLLGNVGIGIWEDELDGEEFDDRYMSSFKQEETTDPEWNNKVKLNTPGFYLMEDSAPFDANNMDRIIILENPQVILFIYKE